MARETDDWCRGEMQAALECVAHRQAIATLASAACGGEPSVELLTGLDVLERTGIAKLALAAQKTDPEVYAACVRAIADWGAASAIPLLIALLGSNDLEARRRGITLLRALARREHGFDPEAPAKDRLATQARWQQWWIGAAQGYR